jgi:hypothetical protein
MSEAEQCDRMRLMRDVVRTRNVFRRGPDAARHLVSQKRQEIIPMASQKPKNTLIQGRFGIGRNRMSVPGPKLPTWASQEVVSYLRDSGRDANILGEPIPVKSFGRSSRGRGPAAPALWPR